MSSSSAESRHLRHTVVQQMLSCATQMFANKCWPTIVGQHLLANICLSCVRGFTYFCYFAMLQAKLEILRSNICNISTEVAYFVLCDCMRKWSSFCVIDEKLSLFKVIVRFVC